MDTDDFFAQRLPANISKKNTNKIIDPLIYKMENSEITVLLEVPIDGKDLSMLKSFLDIRLGVPYQIISVLPYKINSDNIKNVTSLYSKDRVNLKKYISPNSKVICFGRSIYAVTEADDLDIDCFTDIVFNETYFYSSDFKSYFFPCFPIPKWMNLKTWEWYHTIHQINKIKIFEPIGRRIKPLELIVINSIEELYSFYENNKDKKKVAIDTETDSLDFMIAHIGCVQLAFTSRIGYFIDWNLIETNKKAFSEFIKNKYQIYANGKFDIKVFMKAGIDRESLHIDFDTLESGHSLNEMRFNSLKTHAWLYTDHGGYDRELDKYKKEHKIKNYLKIPRPILIPYATKDPIVTFATYEKMLEQIENIDVRFPLTNGWGLQRYLYDIVFPALNMFIDIEYKGMNVNIEKLEEESNILQKKIDDAKNNFLQYVGETEQTCNVESTDDIGKLLEKRGLPEWEGLRNAKGLYSSNDEVLTKYKKLGFKEAEYLEEYRALAILQKTFVGNKKDTTGFWQYVRYDEETKTFGVHPSYAVMLAESGRNKCRDPNLQNIPAHGDYAEFVRGHFTTPSSEYVFMSADYSGLQMRLAAMLSKDKELLDVFINQGGDSHSKSATGILLGNRVSFEDFLKIKGDKERLYSILLKDKEYKTVLESESKPFIDEGWKLQFNFNPNDIRFKAKGFNFGLIFGKGAGAVMEMDIEPYWNKEQCETYIKNNNLEILKYKNSKNVFYTVAKDVRTKYFELYKGLVQWHESSHAFAASNGYIRSIYGAIRRLPELLYHEDINEGRTSNLNNISLNSPIQNMEAVIVMRTMVEISKFIKENGLKSYICGNIHDAIELYVHRTEVVIMRDKIRELGEKIYPEFGGVPLEIEGNVADPSKGEVWDFGKDWKKIA